MSAPPLGNAPAPTRAAPDPGSAPPPELVWRHRVSLPGSVAELWRFRDFLATVVSRELRARSKNTLLGFTWVLVMPVVLVGVFTTFFQRVADVDTGGVSYVWFAYVGLVPWLFFSTAVTTGTQSMIVNGPLLAKVYCPREVFPLSTVALAAIDSFAAMAVAAPFFLFAGWRPAWSIVWLPVPVLVLLVLACGVVLLGAAVLAHLREFARLVPLVLYLGMFASPVMYDLGSPPVPEGLYNAVNPLVGIIDSFRQVVLYAEAPRMGSLLPSAIAAGAWLLVGYWFFKRLEPSFTDVQ